MMTHSRKSATAQQLRLTTVCLLLLLVGCAKSSQDGDSADETDVATDVSNTSGPLPPACDSPPVPAFIDNGCADDADRVTLVNTVSIDPRPPEGEGEEIDVSLRLSCTVEAVVLSSICDSIEVTMTCDDAGVPRKYVFGIAAGLAPEPAFVPGSVVEYEYDVLSTFECCSLYSQRILDAEGVLLASVDINGHRDHQTVEAFIADAFAPFSGHRTASTCTDENRTEYALELTIGGETVAVPDDSALDVSGYRVLVDQARTYGEIDGEPSQAFRAFAIRTSSS